MLLVWLLFGGVVAFSFALDVGLCSRAPSSTSSSSPASNSGVLSIRDALILSLLWVAISMLFNLFLWVSHGTKVALEFLASYLLEKALSVDNVFVFYVIFEHFEIPERYQRRVLQWGIIGALIMRALFITTGIQLLHRVRGIVFFFGALLCYTGAKLLFEGDDKDDDNGHFSDSTLVRFVKRYVPYLDDFGHGRFFLRVHTRLDPPQSRLYATRLFLVLLTVELMDAVFALDSIPAILSLTDDPLVVYTSNVFAILGLRALFFAISGMVHTFHYLKIGLSAILLFVGLKMLLGAWLHIPILAALLFIVSIMTAAIIASILCPPSTARALPQRSRAGDDSGVDPESGRAANVVIAL